MPSRQSSRLRGNRILDALPEELLGRIEIETGVYESQALLMAATRSPEWIFFPQPGCVGSVLRSSSSGETAEVGLSGSEGFIGVECLLSPAAFGSEALVQISGTMSRVRLRDVRNTLSDVRARDLILGFAARYLAQVEQNAVCHRFHTAQQRLAKWLLSVSDRAETNELALTHDFLALVVGVRRPGVTIALGGLQSAGTIEQERGCVRIADRQSLLGQACECYRFLDVAEGSA